MTLDSELPPEANKANALEQPRSVLDDGPEPVVLDELPLMDADTAEAIDQRLTVPYDDQWPA